MTADLAPLEPAELRLIDAYWRAANYLSVGQIYLLDNPLLREPLRPEHVKPRLLGHFGTAPGLNLVYAHLNRAIRSRDLERHLRDRARSRRARPGRERLSGGHLQRGLPAHRVGPRRAAASCSGSSRSRAGSRVTSRPRRQDRSTRAASSATRLPTRSGRRSTTRICSSAAWSATARQRRARWRRAGTATSFSNPSRDGAVLPILHLNGYKIASPTVLARIPERRARLPARGVRLAAADRLRLGAGGGPPGVRARARRGARRDRPTSSRRRLGGRGQSRPRLADDRACGRRRGGRVRPRSTASRSRGPGVPIRSRSPPRARTPSICAILERWLRSYRPDELFDEQGRLMPELTGARAARRAPDEREPARERRRASSRPRAARLPRLRGRGRRSPARARPRRRTCWASSSAT